jgi:hypothetical protein
MSDYIAREEAKNAINVEAEISTAAERALEDAIDGIPAADVVEVTRCKDCKHYRVFLKRDMCAKNAQVLDGHEVGLTATNPDDFCSYGERKSG